MSAVPNEPHHQYDKIWRENMRQALPGIVEKVLGIDIAHSEDLPHKLQVTRQRETDWLSKVTDGSGSEFILHLELQARNDPKMAYRMIEYRIMIEQIYELPVKQFVIYFGGGKLSMPTGLNSAGLRYQYEVVSMSALPYTAFLSSEKPEEQVLAVLADFGEVSPQAVIQQVMTRICEGWEGEGLQNPYIQQLRVMVQLRNLSKHFTKAMESITTFFKEERDPYFIKGELKGATSEREKMILNLIRATSMTDTQIASIAEVTADMVAALRASLKTDKKNP